ncbi:hypothetical protein SETIT_9G015900v2 [Setaria italica]|uniref:Uncharacterized protein n=1 Tax=Setaria italica TaxID=4555 RepID=A0A368SC23_SETIT|nr:hypothetical protein SETIT_9G015900v2 [Setaria italica]
MVGGIKASDNMWALLANDDTGDSEEAVAMASGRKLDDGEAKIKQQPASSGESSGVGGDAPKHGRKDKKASNRKQKKKQPAVANGEHQKNQEEMMMKGPAPAPAVSTEGEANDDDGSDEEDDGGAVGGGSCCRGLLRGLFRTAVFMVLAAVAVNVAGTAGGRPT